MKTTFSSGREMMLKSIIGLKNSTIDKYNYRGKLHRKYRNISTDYHKALDSEPGSRIVKDLEINTVSLLTANFLNMG